MADDPLDSIPGMPLFRCTDGGLVPAGHAPDPVWGRHHPVYVARTDRLGSLIWYEREAYHTPWELAWP